MELLKINALKERLNLLENRVQRYGLTTPNALEMLDVLRSFIHEVSEDIRDPVKMERKKLLRKNLTSKEMEIVDGSEPNKT